MIGLAQIRLIYEVRDDHKLMLVDRIWMVGNLGLGDPLSPLTLLPNKFENYNFKHSVLTLQPIEKIKEIG